MPVTQLPPSQAVDQFQYDDPAWKFVFTTNGSISGDTYKLNIIDGNKALVFSVVPTITDAGSSTTPGVVSADLTGQFDIAAQDYSWELFRTNAGRRKTIANGTLSLMPSTKTL